ncbi:MAG: glucose-6-phosphate isomerase [Acidimicrobiales bacterium]
MADIPQLARRLEAKDASLWPEPNVSANRLGWLAVPREIEREAARLRSFASSIDQDTVVLLGMGGSSLGPAVLASVRDSLSEWEGRRIVVCDTTDPKTISELPLEDAFIVVSSKSGTTLEPNVLFDYARSRVSDPARYAVITDPGTPLAELAGELGVKHVFANRPDIGGRYSVLSYFGMVPAALAGYDVSELCGRALDTDRQEAVELGLAMGQAAREGRDKATIVVSERFSAFGLWIEQLIAESTGKQGRGCVPVPTTEPETGDDRHVIEVSPTVAHELGEEFFRFELAIAMAGHVLEIDPFDEPNVAESKANTNRVLESLPLPEVEASPASDLMAWIASQHRPGDYVSLQAYLPFGLDAQLEALRRRVRDLNGGMATTAGYGPRFLHSTGQLHKGGPNTILAVQIVPPGPSAQLAIPTKSYDFGTLIAAQAIGDHESLLAHERRVVRVVASDLREIT